MTSQPEGGLKNKCITPFAETHLLTSFPLFLSRLSRFTGDGGDKGRLPTLPSSAEPCCCLARVSRDSSRLRDAGTLFDLLLGIWDLFDLIGVTIIYVRRVYYLSEADRRTCG